MNKVDLITVREKGSRFLACSLATRFREEVCVFSACMRGNMFNPRAGRDEKQGRSLLIYTKARSSSTVQEVTVTTKIRAESKLRRTSHTDSKY